MEFFTYSKMQLACLVILLYIGFLYVKDANRLTKISGKSRSNVLFNILFLVGAICLIFDGITACTVNQLDTVPLIVNELLHLCFMLSFQVFIFVYLMYIVKAIDAFPATRRMKAILYAPMVLSLLLTIAFIPKIEYVQGIHTNYSMGISAYITFSIIAAYSFVAMIVFFVGIKSIEQRKKNGFIMSMIAASAILMLEIVFHELLISGLAIVLIIVSIYLNMENPSVKSLEYYHSEMVMGFSTLVENRDDNTGGHIRRTSSYVALIIKELKSRSYYKSLLTKDYMDCLKKAAPMHDIGKIGIPDSILQKPGKLTTEEFEIMKTHTTLGGEIIKDTFGHLDDAQYEKTAYDVAMYHHEKWNGNGYPSHLSREQIPLCARIMAIADVFDALSMKRCYKEAFDLDTCFKIIADGRGTDFDPLLVDIFLELRPKIEEAYYQTQSSVFRSRSDLDKFPF